MAEVLVEYKDVVTGPDGGQYSARAVGAEQPGGLWEGWLEFTDLETGSPLCSPRETTQPNRTDTLYWATGLTPVYLEGALVRALNPIVRSSPGPAASPHFAQPAPDVIEGPPPAESILNPFSVCRKGEALLRRQLAALSAWHLVNIIRAHELSELPPATLNTLPAPDLIELIVRGVQARSESS